MLRGIGTSRGSWDLKALNGSPRQVSNEFMIVHKRFGCFCAHELFLKIVVQFISMPKIILG
jgi:hypothetical protein